MHSLFEGIRGLAFLLMIWKAVPLCGTVRSETDMSGVQSVQRAFSILRALAAGTMGVTEVAKAVDLPKSTVARLLATLEEEGAVNQDSARGQYRIGDGLASMVNEVRGGKSLTALSYSYLTRLATEMGETAGIGFCEGTRIYYADHVEPDAAVQVRSWTGEYAPLHLVPSGIVTLSNFSGEELEAYLAGDLEETSPRSVSKPTEIRSRLALVRLQGYAWGFEEFAEGLNSVAAPVHGAEGEVVATLHVHGPSYRFPKAGEADGIGRRLTQVCSELSGHLI